MLNSDTKLIFITPTYSRPQRYDFIRRCAQQFKNTEPLVWIVVEDGSQPDEKVRQILHGSGIEFVYFAVGPTHWYGNEQRNQALMYVRDHKLEGIIYFADDDNYYDPKLFNQLRLTHKIGLLPVGHLGPAGIERPIVMDGRIVSWSADWESRKFPVDMAGFAFSSTLLQYIKGDLWLYKGFLKEGARGSESENVERLFNLAGCFDFLCKNCSKCYVWHNQPLEQPVWIARVKRKLKVIRLNITRKRNDIRLSMRRFGRSRYLPGSWHWIAQRLFVCLWNRRLHKNGGLRDFKRLTERMLYRPSLRLEIYFHNLFWSKKNKSNERKLKKNLFTAAVGSYGKPYIEAIITKFGHDDFDYMFFVWDDSQLTEEVFKKCKIIKESGHKWHFLKKHVTPDVVREYNFIFAWDDDIDIEMFDYKRFINVMESNKLEVAQPSLTHDSFFTYPLTLRQSDKIGRYVDYVEVMVQVFRFDAWSKFWQIIESDWNFAGWGYDELAKNLCGFKSMAIVDCEAVRHTKPFNHQPDSISEHKRLLSKYASFQKAEKIHYGYLV